MDGCPCKKHVKSTDELAAPVTQRAQTAASTEDRAGRQAGRQAGGRLSIPGQGVCKPSRNAHGNRGRLEWLHSQTPGGAGAGAPASAPAPAAGADAVQTQQLKLKPKHG